MCVARIDCDNAKQFAFDELRTRNELTGARLSNASVDGGGNDASKANGAKRERSTSDRRQKSKINQLTG
jgi:hypothetical protein